MQNLSNYLTSFFSKPPIQSLTPKDIDLAEQFPNIFVEIVKYLPPAEAGRLKTLSKTAKNLTQDVHDGANLNHALKNNKKVSEAEMIRMAENPHTQHKSDSLDLAISKRNVNLAQILVNHPSVDPSKNKNTLVLALLSGDVNLIMAIIRHPQINTANLSPTDLRQLAEKGKVESLEILLREGKIDPSFDSNYLIQFAANNGHVKLVKLMLKDPRVKAAAKENLALNMACQNGHTKIVKMLLEVSSVIKHFDFPKALELASLNNKIDTTKFLLSIRTNPNQLDINAVTENLKEAITKNNYEIVKAFIEYGRFDLNWFHSSEEVVDFLIQHGDLANIRLIVTHPNFQFSNQMLINAASNKQNKIFKFLLTQPLEFEQYHLVKALAKSNDASNLSKILKHNDLHLTKNEKHKLLKKYKFSSRIKQMLIDTFIPNNNDSATLKKIYYLIRPLEIGKDKALDVSALENLNFFAKCVFGVVIPYVYITGQALVTLNRYAIVRSEENAVIYDICNFAIFCSSGVLLKVGRSKLKNVIDNYIKESL